MTTIHDAIEAIETCSAVRSVNKWESRNGSRYYINLMHSNSRAAGDRSYKAWIDEKAGEIILATGKGSMSPEATADADTLRTLVMTLGTVTRQFATSHDITVKLDA